MNFDDFKVGKFYAVNKDFSQELPDEIRDADKVEILFKDQNDKTIQVGFNGAVRWVYPRNLILLNNAKKYKETDRKKAAKGIRAALDNLKKLIEKAEDMGVDVSIDEDLDLEMRYQPPTPPAKTY